MPHKALLPPVLRRDKNATANLLYILNAVIIIIIIIRFVKRQNVKRLPWR